MIDGESYGTIAERDCARKLDDVAGTDSRVPTHEGDQVVDTIINPVVRMEVRLNGGKEEHRSVGTATAVRNDFSMHAIKDGKRYTYALGPLLLEMAIASSGK